MKTKSMRNLKVGDKYKIGAFNAIVEVELVETTVQNGWGLDPDSIVIKNVGDNMKRVYKAHRRVELVK